MKHKIYNLAFVLCCLLPVVGSAQKIGAYSDAVKAVASWKPPVLQSIGDAGAAVVSSDEEPAAVEFAQKLDALKSSVVKVDSFEMLELESDRLKEVKPGRLSLSDVNAPVQKAPARAAQAVTVSPGYYVSKDDSKYNGEMNSLMELVQETADDGSTVWKMKNVYGQSDYPITIDIDTENGGVSIAPQQIGVSSSYGDIYVYKIDLSENKYYPNDPITGTIDDKGVITLGNWAVMTDANGEKAGAIFNAFYSSEWLPSNATVKVVKIDNGAQVEEEYPSFVDQKYDNEIIIHNFANYGKAIYATLTPSKTLKISPQSVAYNLMYGDFCIYPADLTAGKIDTNSPVTGTVVDTETGVVITLSSFVIGQQINPSSVLQIVASTEITASQKLRYPESVTVNFEGQGTEASPYLLKTPADLHALSQSVSGGETYKGRFFKLANDIDMSSFTQLAWTPIGDVTAVFDGTLDGDGKTISNLSVDRRAFNYAGLFGYAGSSAVLKNINMSGAKVKGSGKYGGALAAYIKGTIDNCRIAGSIEVEGPIVGGIVGTSEGNIKNSSFSGSVSGYGSVGGIAGNIHGEMSNCHAIGTVEVAGLVSTADEDCGGLAGEAYSIALEGSDGRTNCLISDCYFSGVISDEHGYGYTGGLVGLGVNMSIERSFNAGMISAVAGSSDNKGSGGLVGFASAITVTDSYNSGTIMRSGTSESAGGLAGYLSVTYTITPSVSINNASTFTNCYNSGMVQSSSIDVNKGLWGKTFKAYGIDPAVDMFKNCWFDTQMNGLKNETFGKPTSFFTSGQLPEGFDSKAWKAEAGYYPVLLSTADVVSATLSKSSVQLANGETIKKVKTDFTLNVPTGVIWKLYSSAGYVDETVGLKISGNTVSIKEAYSNELLIAMASDGSAMKALSLAVVPKAFDGDGTAESPYLIKDKADFIKLHEAVQTHAQSHEDDFFKMTNDIDFAFADDFQGVGGKGGKNPFDGTFDGDGHYIHNLKIHSATYDDSGKADFSLGSYYYAGLFNVCGTSSTIKNLNIADDCDFDFWAQSAPIAGYTNGRIENCRNYADVNGVYTQFGGIVGVADSTAVITRCYNAGNVVAGSTIAGGIVGANLGSVELCQNDGDVAAKFYNAYSKDGNQNEAGGIVGESHGKIDRSINNGTVSAYKKVGGIVGVLGGSGDLTYCVNTGIVECYAVETTRGGVIGNVYSKGVISGNYYDASINTNGAADNAVLEGVTGLSTTELVSGAVLDGLSREEWLFVKGVYPGLMDYAYEDASVALRSTYVKFADGESRNNVVTAAETVNKSALKWTLSDSENFTLTGTKLSVVTPVDMNVAKATLTAVYGDKYTKVYELTSVPQNLFDGKGTADNPYQIKSVEDLNKLADFMASSSMEYEGYYFKVMNDIDYEGGELKPIARGNVNFQGDFDGDGKTISNYTYVKEKYTSANDNYVGLFGSVGAAGVVHDLTVNGTVNGYRYVGGVAGKLYGKLVNVVNKGSVTVPNGTYGGGIAGQAYDGSEIRDSHNEGTVTTYGTYAGGIVADMAIGLIDNCYNTGSVSTVDNRSNYVGGLVAALKGGTVTNCYNTADILGKGYVGGIVATASKDWRIENCYNTAAVTGTGTVVGGVLGSSSAATTNAVFKNNYNTGTITGTGDTGGVAGKIGDGTSVEDSYNTGDVITNKSSNTGGFAGSISGDAAAVSTVLRCWNSGNVISINAKTGGFMGAINDEEVTLEDCYNVGDVSVENSEKEIIGVGGFTGYMSGHAIRCWNAGDVISSAVGVAGISGYASGTAEYCFNLGDITSLNTSASETRGLAGGIWGFGRSTVRYCYNMGTITGAKYIGGISGQFWGQGAVENCYNAGKIVVTGGDSYGSANIAPVRYTDGTVANNYYDKEVSTAEFEADINYATGISSKELFGKTELGDGFEYNRAAYPTIKGVLENKRANLAAVSVEFENAGDNAQNVTGKFYVGMLENVAWTVSDNLEIADDGTVTSASEGAAWVKASVVLDDENTLEKTIDLNIKVATGGVEDSFAGKEVVAKVYYDFAGVEVVVPQHGSLYIVKSIYDDGSASVTKEYYKEK